MEESSVYHVMFPVLSALLYQPTARHVETATFHHLLCRGNAPIYVLLEKLITLLMEELANALHSAFTVLSLSVIVLPAMHRALFLF
jgi:hypothetical protein